MDPVLQEEKQHLAETVEMMQNQIDSDKREIKHLQESIDDFVPVEYWDLENLQFDKTRLKNYREAVAELESSIESPYFGRMDLFEEKDKETIVMYLGKKVNCCGT